MTAGCECASWLVFGSRHRRLHYVYAYVHVRMYTCVCARQALSCTYPLFFTPLPGILSSSTGCVQMSFLLHCWNGLLCLLLSWSRHMFPKSLQVCAGQGVLGCERPLVHRWGELCGPSRTEMSCLGTTAAVLSVPSLFQNHSLLFLLWFCVYKSTSPVPGQLFHIHDNYFEESKKNMWLSN